MEETKNTPAIILNRQDYREQDILVTVYARDFGKRTLVARGAKKPGSKLAGHIEPLALADILVVKGKGRDYIGSALTRRAHQGIRADLNKLYYAGQAVGLFSRLVKDSQPEEEIFSLLSDWLGALDDFIGSADFNREEGELFYNFFALKLLAVSGYAPAWRTCLACGRKIEPGRNFFAARGGGLVCSTCFDQKRASGQDLSDLLIISDNCVKLIRYLSDSQNLKIKVDKKIIREAKKVIDFFVNYL
ncbi:MAG: DNA repair protein RecO [Patescibacteria group bacterium]